MKRHTIRLAAAVFTALTVNFTAGPPTHAQTASERLEKGIYTEETVGNLDEAIKIYRSIVADAKETEALGAKAQYRLASCLSKKGDQAGAVAAYEALIKNYPNQKELVSKAREQLPAKLELGEAPWNDGEQLTLTMKLAGGQPIGLVGLSVKSENLDGKPVWGMSIRRLIAGGQNQGISHVVVDQVTNRPLTSVWQHTLLGSFEGKYSDDQLTITNLDSEDPAKVVELDQVAYDNDQWFYAMRQLPLAVGYKGTLSTRVVMSGGAQVDIGITVPSKETVETPVGSFECFKLEMSIGQTFWFADVPEKYLVKFEAGGVEAVLSNIGDSEPTTVKNTALGFSFAVPVDWFGMDLPSDVPTASTAVVLAGPGLSNGMLRVLVKSKLTDEEQASPRAWMESKLKESKTTFKNLEPDDTGITETTLGQMPAATLGLSYLNGKRKVLSQNVVTFQDEKGVALYIEMPEDDADDLKATLMSIADSIQVK
ncbi:DUF3108 domain-containing protein [Novipirellula artificiosorum]|uniref:Tetratricopeptide repeat protein n=1 Tax=Novipirellula artificiosorum TaxID=2528016 RepID=A0A5C6E127_9BACT|nr:tetratricopeptide repeat protein [Novipirellula artificiosorum]TWU42425.1 hypothetical protein Poly41_07220 [Novipirellula artificiosorum]